MYQKCCRYKYRSILLHPGRIVGGDRSYLLSIIALNTVNPWLVYKNFSPGLDLRGSFWKVCIGLFRSVYFTADLHSFILNEGYQFD